MQQGCFSLRYFRAGVVISRVVEAGIHAFSAGLAGVVGHVWWK
jgi:hypothetical protein